MSIFTSGHSFTTLENVLNYPDTFPKLVLRLDKEEEDGEVLYLFSCMLRYTGVDFTIHGGARSELDRAIEELATIAPHALDDMVEGECEPAHIEVLISKSLPDMEGIYQKLTFQLNLEEYGRNDIGMTVPPTSLN
jgi:hypothetical protein